MDLEKYNRYAKAFSEVNCSVEEEEVLRRATHSKNRPWRAIATIAACLTLVFIGTTISVSAAGWIDLPSVFKKLFSDEVTTELIEEGALQEFQLKAQKGDYTITFEGITGDSNTQYGVFKLVDPTGEIGNPSHLRIDLIAVGKSVVEKNQLEQYGSCMNESFLKSEDEENTYYLKVFMPSYWTYYSEEDIYMLINNVTAYYGEVVFYPNSKVVESADQIVEIPFHQEFTFTLDTSIFPKSIELNIDKAMTSEVSEFTLKTLEVSRYHSELIVTFPTKESIIDMFDATALWHNIDNDYIYEYIGYAADFEERRKIESEHIDEEHIVVSPYMPEKKGHRLYKTVKNPSKYTVGDIKLYVNGEEIKRSVLDTYNWASAMDSEVNPTTWGIIVSFEPFELSEAKSIVMKYKDQEIVVK